MDKKEFYHPSSPHTWLGTRISPHVVKDLKYTAQWQGMTRFEKLCWAWYYINSYALRTLPNHPNAKVVRFESLFLEKEKEKNMQDLIEFALEFDGFNKQSHLDPASLLEKKVNQPSTYSFPGWREWDPEMINQLQTICGPLLETFRYGQEEEWLEQISQNVKR